MRLIDRLAGRAYSEAKMSGAAITSTWGAPGHERIPHSFQGYVSNGYGSNAVIHSLINARAAGLSEVRFRFRNLESRELFGTEALRKLEHPWPNGTTGELVWRMEQDGSLAGNAYVRDLGTRLERMRPDWVTIVSLVDPADPEAAREVVGVLYCPKEQDRDNREIFIPIREVCHWAPIPDPLANYRGMSWLTAVISEINADTAMTGHKQKLLDNAATPNLIVKYQQRLPKPILDELRAELHLNHEGKDNAGRTLVLDAGADPMVVGLDFRQMQFDVVQAAGENRIAAAAGVPGIVVGLKEGLQAATYSNYEQAMRRFADLTLRPLWRSLCAALGSVVEVPADSELWYDVSDVAALRAGEKERAEIANIKAQIIGQLIRSGYKPESVTPAVVNDDFDSLEHSGNVPVTLYPDGQEPAAAKPGASPEDQGPQGSDKNK